MINFIDERRSSWSYNVTMRAGPSLSSSGLLHSTFFTVQISECGKVIAQSLAVNELFTRPVGNALLAFLTLSTLGKNFSRRHFEMFLFFVFFPAHRIWHFMQIISHGDNLYEMSNLVFWEKIRKMSPICRLLH